MKIIDINTWNRKQLYYHFKDFTDPYFGLTIPFDVTIAYKTAKIKQISFFGKYLHDCMKAINAVDNLRYRIVDNNVVDFETIHASPTLSRTDKTYGFSFIKYHEEIDQFLLNLKNEKDRVERTAELYPKEEERLDCIHCSTIPWVNFTSQKEPNSGRPDSVPKLAFGKVEDYKNKQMMHVAISVNHALVDGYHVGLFAEQFQKNLNLIV